MPDDVHAKERPQFAHLHLHSEYSLLDGANKLERLVERVKELGMDSVAVTDHGNLHGAVEFYNAARSAGVKPILGIEAYVAIGDRRERVQTGIADGGFHLVLLAENLAGWRNLMKLSSDAYLNGFYYKPRMDKSTLEQWGAGLIAINGHLGSSLAHHLTLFAQTQDPRHWEDARNEALWHAKTFGANERGEPRFYVELQRHIEEQWRIDPLLQKLAQELGLPLVCDNDAHFLRAEDHDTHDTLCCISMARTKDSTDRLRYPEQLYVKSPEEMSELFADVPDSLRNACAIAARCNVELPQDESHAPLVRVKKVKRDKGPEAMDATEAFTEFCRAYELRPFDATQASAKDRTAAKSECDEALRELSEAGLMWRYGKAGITEAIRTRLERELKILADKSISAYFLIVWDFVNWARQQGIPAIARGSGVGTMVGYVLGLSNACPERFGLLFERFTDPDRSEYPDIDVDICQDGRARVLEYVRNKYGHVAQIITFGRLKAKAAVKDVARVMGLSPSEGQRLANMVPAELHITLAEAIEREEELQKAMKADPLIAKVLEHAQALEDHARHAGIHAAGVVIATRPLDEIVPLCRATGGGDEVVTVTQWDGPTCEQAGLLKMDFLGLRTLTTIERCRQMIRSGLSEGAIWAAVGRSEGDGGPHPLDLDRIPTDDQRVLSLFRRGDTMGIFQFESGGMRKLLVDMQPDRLEDLIAANALFRPGPMDLIPDFNARKHKRQAVPKLHDLVDKLTAETYGIMVYQEQVMQVLHQLGGIPLRAAYTVIKAISKKKTDVIESARADFVAGSVTRGVDPQDAANLFELILRFAGYGFNKSHSTGYAIVAYQTAYLKTFFPAFYMASVLSLESQARKIEEWAVYLDDCNRCLWPDSTKAKPHVGVEVKPPDINRSENDFAVVFEEGETADACHGHVRFGLRAINGVGDNAVRAAVAERKKGGAYRDFFEFCERADAKAVTKATLESLVKGGVFDALHGVASRAALLAAIPEAVRAAQQKAKDKLSGQLSMFGSFDESATAGKKEGAATPLPNVPPWDRATMLSMEKEALGFHVSGHPLDDFAMEIRSFCTADSRAIAEMPADAPLVLAGVVSRVRATVSQKGREPGRRMAMLTFSDRVGQVDGVIFPESFAKHGEHLQVDRVVIAIGHLDRSRAEPSIIVDRVIPIQRAQECLAMKLEIRLRGGNGQTDSQLRGAWNMVAGVLRQSAGGMQSLDGRPVDTWLRLQLEDGREVVMMARGLRVVPDQQLLSRVRAVLADLGEVTVHGGWTPPAKKPRGWQGSSRRGAEVMA
ncbi:MAG: DNA polymerase III subunit alpha [Planctomycetes bacterium]|nr:DNA polymerase III subunit alpha [Planctomycetota bacterium]